MVKVALVGAGFMGRMHAACYAKLARAGKAGIAWVVDSDPEKARATAAEYGGRAAARLEQALADPDVRAVDICLPTHLHREAVEMASAAQKDILCEKPLALDLADADRMLDAARRAGVSFMVGQVIRFWPEYCTLAEICRSGELGDLLSLSMRRMGTAPTWSWSGWMLEAEKSGLAALDLHIHDTDFLYCLLGEPREVTSRFSRAVHGRIHSIFNWPGIVASAEAGWDTPPSMPFMMSYQAIFEKGMIDFDTRLSPAFSIYRGELVEHPEFERITAGEAGGNISELGGYFHEIEYFVDCLAGGRYPERASAASARESLALVLREIECARRAGGGKCRK